MEKPTIADLNRLTELMDSTYQGSSRFRALREELDNLSREREEAEKTETEKEEEETESDTVEYWKKKASRLEKSLEESTERLVESKKAMEALKAGEGFLSFILESAPFVMGHQDQDLRYMFISNKIPTLKEEDILGKTASEIFSGSGVEEFEDFKREVLAKGKASKREITFGSELFGPKTFLMYVEPVYNKTGKKIGINYIGMEVTDQVKKREKLAKIREENAVKKAMEPELQITEEMVKAKQRLAKMSGEIRSPLLGIVSMAERFSSTTKLDEEQRQLLNEMISSAELALGRISEFVDHSKVESG